MEIKTYDELRPLFKSGDLMEFAANSTLGSAIRYFTKQGVNHSTMCLNFDDYKNFAGNRKFIIEAEVNGINMHTASQDIKTCLSSGGSAYWYPLLSQYDSCRPALEKFALSLDGKPYDYGSLLKNAMSKVSANMRHLFCSEAVFCTLVGGGVLSDYFFDAEGNVIDSNNKPVMAPRPGEFCQYKVYGEPVMILL